MYACEIDATHAIIFWVGKCLLGETVPIRLNSFCFYFALVFYLFFKLVLCILFSLFSFNTLLTESIYDFHWKRSPKIDIDDSIKLFYTR